MMFNQIDERTSLKYRHQNQINDNLIKRLQLFGTLDGHEGCVNALEWNYYGTRLVSVSDDCNVILWDPFKKKKITQFHSNHSGNIFASKFLEYNHENLLVTGAADAKCILHDLITHDHLMTCECHRQRVKKLATTSYDSSLFWSAGEDGLVLQNDIRTSHHCNQNKVSNVLINLRIHTGPVRISSISCNPVRTEYIAVGANDQFIRLYDRRMIRTIEALNTKDNLPENCVKYFSIGNPNSKRKSYHSLSCTNLSFSQTGDELLANISSDNIYLYNILNPKKPKIFTSDLIQIFGKLDEDKNLNLIDDCSSSSVETVKKMKISSINNNNLNDSQLMLPSTSRCDNQFRVEMIDLEESINYQSKQLIKKINKQLNPNLIKYKAKAKLPKHISTLYKNAQSYFKKQKYSDAIDLINEAICIMPNVSRFYCLRANAYRQRKWTRDLFCALKDFYKSIEIDPNNKESHLKLAECLYELNYYEIAYQCLNYFRQNQSKDTRYKEFKELEKKIQTALKQQDKQNDKKKFTEIKNKNDGGYRKFVEKLSKPPFSLSSQNSSSATDQLAGQTSSSLLSSSSTSSSSLSTSSSLDSFHEPEPRIVESNESSIDTLATEQRNNRSVPRYSFNLSRSSQSDFDSDNDTSRNSKRIQSEKELQWRADSYDFKQRFYGHCNVSTDIMEANFFGSCGQYIVGGSDDGFFYIWDRKTTNIVNIIKADEHIVNCVQPHYNSCFLATSGIDNNVKLWAPTMSEDDLKEEERTRKTMIRQKVEENQNRKTNGNFGIMFLRVTNLNESSDSDDDQSSLRQATLNIRECLPS